MKFTRRVTPVFIATLALAARLARRARAASPEWSGCSGPPSRLVHTEPGEPDQEREDARQRVAHARRLDLSQLRPGVLGQAGLRRSLRRLPDHRRVRPRTPAPARRLPVPGLPARRLGLGTPAVRVGRDAAVQPGMRLDHAMRPASRACGSSTSPTRRRRGSSRAYRPTAARTPTRWYRTRKTAGCCSTSRPTRRRRSPSPRMATPACVSTRRAARDTTRSRSSRCRSTIRRARASSASRASRRTSTATAGTAVKTYRSTWRSTGRRPRAWARARSGTSPTRRTRDDRARPQRERRVLPLGDVRGTEDRGLRRRGRRRDTAALP